jgi:hypothetical protein
VALATAELMMGQRAASDSTLEKARPFLIVALGQDFFLGLQQQQQSAAPPEPAVAPPDSLPGVDSVN